MLKKFLAKLREKIAPAKKSAPSAAAPTPAKPVGREHDGRRQGGDGARRGEGQGHGRGGHGRGAGEGRNEGRSGRRRAAKGFSTTGGERGGRGGGRGEGGGGRRDDFRGDSRGPREPRERPVIDKNYDHPRATPVKPAVPIDVPKMDTAFSKLGLSDALAFGVQEMGYVEPTPIQAQAIPVVLSGRRS